jgi:C4-type Zn-finger protein
LKGKQKQSAHDSDEGKSIASSKSKRHSNARSNTKSHMKSSAQESKGLGPAMMTNVAGTLNRLSDAMVMSVSATPQGAIQSAVQRIQQGHDNLMENGCMYLTKIVSDNANKASAYIAQAKLKSCYRWIMMELKPYREQINELDVEDNVQQ